MDSSSAIADSDSDCVDSGTDFGFANSGIDFAGFD